MASSIAVIPPSEAMLARFASSNASSPSNLQPFSWTREFFKFAFILFTVLTVTDPNSPLAEVEGELLLISMPPAEAEGPGAG